MNREKIAVSTEYFYDAAPAKALWLLEECFDSIGAEIRLISDDSQCLPEETVILPFSVARGRTGPASNKGETDFLGKPEAFMLDKEIKNGVQFVRISGSDDIGLTYGIFELMGQIKSGPEEIPVFDKITPVSRVPELDIRSVCIFLHNKELEEEWVYSPDFWDSYFRLLAMSRYNFFTLTFGHQTSYMSPLYPFLIEVPRYGHVKVPSLTREEKLRNLEMLKMASEKAEQWGIKFILGIWQQHSHEYGENMVEGLKYEDLFDYCPKALAVLLKECPKIKGVQFRMNGESGIKEDDQYGFFHGMLEAIGNCGRPMWIDLRAKGLRDATIRKACELFDNITVSAKFWCEHMGLPYPAAEINPADMKNYRRYGYWDLLKNDKKYKVMYRLWTLGTQKILLWGDLSYARRFAENCKAFHGIGFEVCAPLMNKGYMNWKGGKWHILSDRKLEYYHWEFQRYWAFYLAFGLEGYSKSPEQSVFKGELAVRFGKHADIVREAYGQAGKILPLITAFHAPSASIFRYWPEMDTGGLTDSYAGVPSGDEGRFYSIDKYVEDYLSGDMRGKAKPQDIAVRLKFLADSVYEILGRVSNDRLKTDCIKEFNSTRLDFLVTAELARYHASRILSGVGYSFFRKTSDRNSLLLAIDHAADALTHWKKISELTDGVYYDHMVFNAPPDHIGHWKDETPFLEHDLKRLKEIDRLFVSYLECPGKSAGLQGIYPWYNIEMEWEENNGVLKRRMGRTVKAEPLKYPVYEGSGHLCFNLRNVLQSPEEAVREALLSAGRSAIAHTPVKFAEGDGDIPVYATLMGEFGRNTEVKLYSMMEGRDEKYACTNMKITGKGIYEGILYPSVPGASIKYYIEAGDENGIVSFNGTETSPHVCTMVIPGAKPVILHERIESCVAGADISIKAIAASYSCIRGVMLHYRHMIQTEAWICIDMRKMHGNEYGYEAVIPGEFIVPEWDLMYALEVIDQGGGSVYYPDIDAIRPYFIVRIIQGDK